MRPLIITAVAAFVIGAGAGFGVAQWRKTAVAAQAEKFAEKQGEQTLDLRVSNGGTYRVRSVVDGDTIVLENGLHVRYHGVNCPEAGHFVKDPAPLSAEATARNIALVEGKQVRLKLAAEPLDKYGRVIATVYLAEEKEDIGRKMLREGLGRIMTIGLTPEQQAALKECENAARASKLGLWGLEDKARAAGAKPYCASTTGKVYHVSVCSVAARIKAANLHEYATAEDAETAGLTPCSVCKPR
jgi:micrococcal nuclease